MNVVGCDSSGRFLGLALMSVDGDPVGGGESVGGGKFLAGTKKLWRRRSAQHQSHGDLVVPMLAELLEEGGMELDNVDAFGVVAGPGSFTGLRVGYAVFKTLAHTLSKGFYGYNKFELLGRGLLPSLEPSSLMVVAVPAGDRSMYWAVGDGDSNTDEVGGARYGSIDGFCSFLLEAAGKKPRIVMEGHPGSWLAMSSSDFASTKKQVLRWLGDCVPGDHAAAVAEWACDEALSPQKPHRRSALSAQPLYIKPSFIL